MEIQFVSWGSIASFGVASMVVTAVTNTVRYLFGCGPKWPAFIISIGISSIIAYNSNNLSNLSDFLLLFFNACLLFCSATGMNDLVSYANDDARDKGSKQYGKETNTKRKWLWYWI